MTEWEHKLYRKYAREHFGNVDIYGLATSKQAIFDLANQWYKTTHGDRSKAARLQKIGSYQEILQTESTTVHHSDDPNANDASERAISDIGLSPKTITASTVINGNSKSNSRNSKTGRKYSNKNQSAKDKQPIDIIEHHTLNNFGVSFYFEEGD